MAEAWRERILCDIGGFDYQCDAPMAAWTTFKVGGPADLLTEPRDTEQLTELLRRANAEKVPVQLIGGGSNLIVRDGGIVGLVIVLGDAFAGYTIDRERGQVRAAAGTRLIELARQVAEEGLSGLEFASGIPGTLGGAVTMNAGAYGGEMSGIVERVQILDQQYRLRWLDRAEMEFGYRESIVQRRPWWIVAAELRLQPDEAAAVKARCAELAVQRRSKQPLQYPSAGSTFKRPPGHFAGQLIEASGLKGCRIGGAEVSQMHAGFIINRGGATATDVLQLIAKVQQEVWQQQGVQIEPEVRIIGVEPEERRR